MANPTEDEKRELWIAWASDAISAAPVPEDAEDDPEKTAEHLVEVATLYADWMLDAFEERFSKSGGTRARRARKKARRDDPDDDDDLDN